MAFVVCLLLLILAKASLIDGGQIAVFSERKEYLPIVLWHGMGDNCCNERSTGRVKAHIEQTLPGVYVRSIRIGSNQDEDIKQSYFGNLNDQVAAVCAELAADPLLGRGFNAIGFSQGGQALRAYIQRCNSPAVRQLVTFGSQHAGVADIPNCIDRHDRWCNAMRTIVRRGVYLPLIQNQIVQAQYFKDPSNSQKYLEASAFLADINNERPEKNETYAKNLSSLERFIMIQFANDSMVYPKGTAWFDFIDSDGNRLPLREQPLYKEDWLGLRQLDDKGRLVFLEVVGDHMRITLEYLSKSVLIPYLSEFVDVSAEVKENSLLKIQNILY